LKRIIIIDSEREIDGKIETETRLYITSLVLLANALGPIVRSHWAVENSLHWVMGAIAGVHQHDTARDAGLKGRSDLVERDLRLGAEHEIIRNASLAPANGIG